MLARFRKSMAKREEGFTLIELLVVMIIIGILAAIAIPVFLNQRSKAQDSSAKSDVSTLGKELATYFIDGSTAPTIASTSSRYVINGVDAGKQSSNVWLDTSYGAAAAPTSAPASLTTTGMTRDLWCVGVYNASGTQKTYKYSAQNGFEIGQCTSATAP
jgi:type IV pilus assembly protein PilA